MALPSLDEIKERKVVQWGLAYLGGAWLVLQVVSVLGATYGWPSGLLRAVPVVLAVGFLVALVVAWYHGERGAQKVSGVELAILTGLLVVAGLGVMLVAGGGEATAEAEGNGAETELVGVPDPQLDETAIAVLPFEAIGGDGIFAAGLTDELHQTLSLVPALRVTAQTSAGVFRQASVSADSIGRALNVNHLVEGTVRETGEGRVRISARLVDAGTGRQEWSATYDRDVADVLAVQEEIARAVAVELRVEVGSAMVVGRAPSDPEAYALVVRARQLEERAFEGFEMNVEQAKGLYIEAIVLDSTYAPAWAGLASVHGSTAAVSSEPETELEQAVAAAERALLLDPNEGTAHKVLGTLAMRADPETGKHHLKLAVAANPTDASALALLAFTAMLLGDEAGAIRMAERVAILDPLSPDALQLAATLHSYAGRHERAIELGRACVALGPDQPLLGAFLANILAPAGQAEEAIVLAQRALDAEPNVEPVRRVLAFAYAKAGNRAEAERVFNTLAEGSHMMRASIEAGLGDRDAAFAALERSIVEERQNNAEIPIDNWLRSLHDDPRWEPLVARIRAGAGQE